MNYVECSYWLTEKIASVIRKGALVQLFGRMGNKSIITDANSLKLFDSQKMDRIKNISFFDNNDKIMIYKKNNEWIKHVIKDDLKIVLLVTTSKHMTKLPIMC